MALATEQPLITLESQLDNRQYQSIYIDSNKGTYTFKRNTYDHLLLEKIIFKHEYNSIINRASIIMGDSLLKKKQYDSFTIPLKTKILYSICIVCLVLYVGFFYAAERSVDNNVVYFILSSLFISTGVIITIYQSYSSFFMKDRTYLTINEIIQIDLKKYFEEVNLKYYNKLFFIFDPDERSIECKVYCEDKRMYEEDVKKEDPWENAKIEKEKEEAKNEEVQFENNNSIE